MRVKSKRANAVGGANTSKKYKFIDKKVLKSAHGSVIIGSDRVGFSSLSAAKMGSCLADEGCIAAVENLHPLNHIREKNIQASLCSKCLL